MSGVLSLGERAMLRRLKRGSLHENRVTRPQLDDLNSLARRELAYYADSHFSLTRRGNMALQVDGPTVETIIGAQAQTKLYLDGQHIGNLVALSIGQRDKQ